MPKRTIICQNCTRPHETSAPNCKLCRVCQVTRDLLFVDDWKHPTCEICGTKYQLTRRPSKRNEGVCPSCEALGRGGARYKGDCKCGATDVGVVHPTVPLCFKCFGDPEKRDALITALRKLQVKASNGDYS